MSQKLYFEKHSEMLSIGFQITERNAGLSLADCENEPRLTQELKRLGLKCRPIITINHLNKEMVCTFDEKEGERELVINFTTQQVPPTVAMLVGKILKDWGYDCRVMRKFSEGFNEHPSAEIFYEKRVPEMMRSV